MTARRFPIAGLMGLVVLAALAFASLKFATDAWAGIILPLTLLLMAIAALAAILADRDRRGFWLGFSMFGWGYLALVSGTWWAGGVDPSDLVTTGVLDTIFANRQIGEAPERPASGWFARVKAPDPKTVAIQKALQKPITIPFGQPTPLEDALKYLRSATVDASLPGGVPIYIDPVGLQEAEKTMNSSIQLDLKGVPLRKSLPLMLRQLDLAYRVRDGLLTITSIESSGDEDDPLAFRRIGQCWWTLLAAILGGIVGRFLEARRIRGEAPRSSSPLGV